MILSRIINSKEELEEILMKGYDAQLEKEERIVLFHGSDENVLRLNDDERSEYNYYCSIIIKTLANVYRDNNFIQNISVLKDKTDNIRFIVDAYNCACAICNGNEQYTYNHFYLTASQNTAYDYSKRSWIYGELGYVSYWLLQGIETFKYKVIETKEFIKAREEIAKKSLQKKNPCIIVFPNVILDDIELDTGEELYQKFLLMQYPAVRVKSESLSCFFSQKSYQINENFISDFLDICWKLQREKNLL